MRPSTAAATGHSTTLTSAWLMLQRAPLQVYQGIDEPLEELDNIVELRRMALPSLPFGPRNQDAEALLTLKHKLAVMGPRTLQITFIGTDVSLQGGSCSGSCMRVSMTGSHLRSPSKHVACDAHACIMAVVPRSKSHAGASAMPRSPIGGGLWQLLRWHRGAAKQRAGVHAARAARGLPPELREALRHLRCPVSG